MRSDQTNRAASGQYNSSESRPGHENAESLENLIAYRVTDRELRTLSILFDQHRAEFGWQTKSDMMRQLAMMGATQASAKLKKRDPELTARLEQFHEISESAKRAWRHTDLDRALEHLDRDIQVMFRAGDLRAVRDTLREFKDRTKRIEDKVIQARREDEFERRWGRLLGDLERNHSLKPAGTGPRAV